MARGAGKAPTLPGAGPAATSSPLPLPPPQVRTWLAGEAKRTRSVKAERRGAGEIGIDQEARCGGRGGDRMAGAARCNRRSTKAPCPPPQLEFVLDGDAAGRPHRLELELWGGRWRRSSALAGACPQPPAAPSASPAA